MRKFTPVDIIGWHDKYEWERNNIINDELQHYREKNNANSIISGSNTLLMTVIAEAVHGAFFNNEGDKWDTQQYSSAMFQSQGKELVGTGDTVTIRVKLGDEDGLFSAFWLLRADAVWAKTEIDIFETTKHIKDGSYHIAHHSHTAEGGTYEKHAEIVPAHTDLVNEFNDYGVKIERTKITYLFNGRAVRVVDLHEHEYDLQYYMLLNVAVAPAGAWAGAEAGTEYTWDKSTMEVEYITVTRDDDSLVEVAPVAEVVQEEVKATEIGAVKSYDDQVNERYSGSPKLAQLLYNVARELGGKL